MYILTSLIEVFDPYLLFINGLIVISLNLVLIFKGVNWIVIIIFNVLISLILNLIGLGGYDLLTQLITGLVDILIDIFKGIWDAINPFTIYLN